MFQTCALCLFCCIPIQILQNVGTWANFLKKMAMWDIHHRYCWWFRNPANQLSLGSLYHYYSLFTGSFRWCRISSINSSNGIDLLAIFHRKYVFSFRVHFAGSLGFLNHQQFNLQANRDLRGRFLAPPPPPELAVWHTQDLHVGKK